MAVRRCRGCRCDLCWQRGGRAAGPVPGVPATRPAPGTLRQRSGARGGGADIPSRRVPGHRCEGRQPRWDGRPSITLWWGGSGGRGPGVTRCSLLLQAAARGDVLPAPGPCRPPTRRPSARGRAGASGHAGASGRTAASARAASPPAPPGTPCPGTCPSTSRRSGRARTRCWTRPRGLSSGSQVRRRPLLGRAAGPQVGGLTLRWPRWCQGLSPSPPELRCRTPAFRPPWRNGERGQGGPGVVALGCRLGTGRGGWKPLVGCVCAQPFSRRWERCSRARQDGGCQGMASRWGREDTAFSGGVLARWRLWAGLAVVWFLLSARCAQTMTGHLGGSAG